MPSQDQISNNKSTSNPEISKIGELSEKGTILLPSAPTLEMSKSERADIAFEKIVPEIIEEVGVTNPESEPLPESTSDRSTELPAQHSGTSVRSATKRESDENDFQQNISNYLESIIILRDRYANRLYALLLLEVILMFGIVISAGLDILKLEAWLVTIVAESILIKTFLTIQIIVKNLFPNKGLFELLVQQQKNK